MRADMGISTLIIFIVIVLIATVAAVVLLNAASALKGQAEMTQKESQSKFTNRLQVVDIYGFVDTNDSSPLKGKIRYIKVLARLPRGADPIDLRKVFLKYSDGYVVKTASFIDSSDADNTTTGDPCEKTDSYVENVISTRSWVEMGKTEEYTKLLNGDLFTVAWVDCRGKDTDLYLFPEQLVYIYYFPPNGLDAYREVELSFIVAEGGTTRVRFITPEVFDSVVIKLYG